MQSLLRLPQRESGKSAYAPLRGASGCPAGQGVFPREGKYERSEY